MSDIFSGRDGKGERMTSQVLNLYTLYILSDVNSTSCRAGLCKETGERSRFMRVSSPLFAFSGSVNFARVKASNDRMEIADFSQ